MKRSSLLTVCSCLAVLLINAASLFAQGNRASITCTVFDSSGAVVVGAHIVARNIDTGVETPTVSNGSGIYLVPNLPPGTYSVFVRKEGFKQVEFTHITLILDQVAELNATLAAGVAVEAVTVTGGAPGRASARNRDFNHWH
jgi:Carboxypeptidase regulatory-like domain